MRKRLTAAVAAGSLGLAGLGAAVAIPALADAPSPSASPSNPGAGPDRAERTSRTRQLLQSLVDDTTITAEQADKIATKLAQQAGPGPGGFGYGPGPMGGPGPESLAAVATALGMSEADVRSALRDGTTLAALAKRQGKSEDAVVAAIVDAAKQRIAAAVKDGKLSQDQADTVIANLPQRVREFVENGRPAGPRPDGRHFGDRGSPSAT